MDPTTIGARFPFDVLGVIFDFYLDEEAVDFPLETMLLVCRSWNEAALGHRNLWARLKIYLGHFPTSEVWTMRLPRRLERAGDSTPLEIDLRSILDSPNSPQGVRTDFDQCNRLYSNVFGDLTCSWVHTARRTAKELLIMLTGSQGELCHRWKSLYLGLSPHIDLGKGLAYPTPNLKALWLELPFIPLSIAILPSIPKLKTFEVFRPYSLPLPKIENVRHLVILDLSRVIDLSNLKTATNVETLTIGTREMSPTTSIPYSLPQPLPRLSSMSFIGNSIPSSLNEIQAPNIRRLSLKSTYPTTLKAIVASSLPLCDLQELHLTWTDPHLWVNELRTTTSDLLLSCISLTHIEGDMSSLSVIVKWYWEDCTTRRGEKGHIIGKTLNFWSNDMKKGVSVTRPEGKSELEGVALSLGLIPPSISWEIILSAL